MAPRCNTTTVEAEMNAFVLQARAPTAGHTLRCECYTAMLLYCDAMLSTQSMQFSQFSQFIQSIQCIQFIHPACNASRRWQADLAQLEYRGTYTTSWGRTRSNMATVLQAPLYPPPSEPLSRRHRSRASAPLV